MIGGARKERWVSDLNATTPTSGPVYPRMWRQQSTCQSPNNLSWTTARCVCRVAVLPFAFLRFFFNPSSDSLVVVVAAAETGQAVSSEL